MYPNVRILVMPPQWSYQYTNVGVHIRYASTVELPVYERWGTYTLCLHSGVTSIRTFGVHIRYASAVELPVYERWGTYTLCLRSGVTSIRTLGYIYVMPPQWSYQYTNVGVHIRYASAVELPVYERWGTYTLCLHSGVTSIRTLGYIYVMPPPVELPVYERWGTYTLCLHSGVTSIRTLGYIYVMPPQWSYQYTNVGVHIRYASTVELPVYERWGTYTLCLCSEGMSGEKVQFCPFPKVSLICRHHFNEVY